MDTPQKLDPCKIDPAPPDPTYQQFFEFGRMTREAWEQKVLDTILAKPLQKR